MEILLHTIALEPARWTPQRVSTPLVELLPVIADAGFRKLEVFEPHLSFAPDEAALPCVFKALQLEPLILSSYLHLNPALTDDARFAALSDELEARVRRFGFTKVRLFPGSQVDPGDDAVIAVVQDRIFALAARMPEVEFLLETHDHSIADSPERIVALVRDLAMPNVGLLYQPTLFEAEPAWRQFSIQKPWIRHYHLQNRTFPERKLVLLTEGVVPWGSILSGTACSGSLEFLPAGMSPVETFDLKAVMAEAIREAAVAQQLSL